MNTILLLPLLVLLQDPAPAPPVKPAPAPPASAEPTPAPPLREPQMGLWRCWLESPGGPLPFGLEIETKGNQLKGALVNGAERSRITTISLTEDHRAIFVFHHYDGLLLAEVNESRTELKGLWKKRGRGDQFHSLPFFATWGDARRFLPPEGTKSTSDGKAIAGRWSVQFESEKDPAVALLTEGPDGSVVGTFLTIGGDYRYLAGDFIDQRLRLSTFDGAHAFLFDARQQEDGTLAGDFWSGDSWHDTWKARRDDQAALPDPTKITRAIGDPVLHELIFFDNDKIRRALDEQEFAGRVRIIEVMGTWCPNCHDSAALMMDLHRKYHDRGLSIVALAFEYTSDINRNLKQVKTFAGRVGVEFPILLAEETGVEGASRALPFLDRVRAFPTTIFLDHEGQVRMIDTGFSGPATGKEHDQLRQRYEMLIEELLAAAPPVEKTPSHETAPPDGVDEP